MISSPDPGVNGTSAEVPSAVPLVMPPLPVVPLPDPAELPAELRDSGAWIVWRAEWQRKADKWKLEKLPCDRGGRTHAMTDPAIRSGLADALIDAHRLRRRGTHYGVGLTFAAVEGFFALDLDGDLAGGHSDRLTLLVRHFPTWGEKSISGRGAHLFYRGRHDRKTSSAWRGSGLEIFGTTGFVAMTGTALDGATPTLADGAELLDRLAAEMRSQSERTPPPRTGEYRHRLDVGRWLSDRGVAYRVKANPTTDGRTVYVLAACPFNPDHADPDSCVM